MPQKYGRLEPLPRFRGTTVQVCGLWPFSGGTGAPLKGVPVGKHQINGVTVAGDPINYFINGLISAPSCWLQGNPGLGKSTLACRIIIGLEAQGIHSLIFGDLKPDYVATIRALGGQVIRLGRGRGHLNILDHSYAERAAAREDVPGPLRQELLADIHGRRYNGVLSLINVMRHNPATERESQILDRALQILARTWHGPAEMVIDDLRQVVEEAPPELHSIALTHGSKRRYRKETNALLGSLQALSSGTGIGEIFSRRTDVQMMTDRSVCFDVSSIDATDSDLQAATLLACWNYGFGQVETLQILADAKVIPRQNFLVVMDELWRPLRTGRGMVDRMDGCTRLNRTQGIGLLYITHSLDDLSAIADDAERIKAQGIAERCGMFITFGLRRKEVARVIDIVDLTDAETNMIVGWSTPPSWDPSKEPPGLGRFLIKVAGRTGLPIRLSLTSHEKKLHNTNHRWESKAS